MAENNRVLKREIIDEVDKRFPSPSERAVFIWDHLQKTLPDISTWDVLCFAVESIGMQSTAYPWLKNPAIAINNLLYHAHYFEPDLVNVVQSGVPRARREDQPQPSDSRKESERESNPRSTGLSSARFDFG